MCEHRDVDIKQHESNSGVRKHGMARYKITVAIYWAPLYLELIQYVENAAKRNRDCFLYVALFLDFCGL